MNITKDQQARRQCAANHRKIALLKILEAAPTISKSCSFWTQMLGYSKWDSLQIKFTRQALNSLIKEGKGEKSQKKIKGFITNFYGLAPSE